MPLFERRRLASTYQDYRLAFIDLAVIGVVLVALFLITRNLDWFEWLYAYTRAHEDRQIDEVIVVVVLMTAGLIAFGARRIVDQRREIKARQKAEDRARHLALADTLTGLPNRRQFEARLVEALARLPRDGAPLAVMMIDLDRFKPVNDVFGHLIGDEVLVAFSRRAAALMPNGLIARFGGDEFAVLLTHTTGEDEPTRVARRLLAVFDRPFEVGGVLVTLGASIGIAMAPADGLTPGELLRRADVALYRAKTGGRGMFRFFEAAMDAEVRKRAQLERDLRQAIADASVTVNYQPIVELKSGAITGFEALARWHHPVFGDIPPKQFVGIAEDGGFVTELSTHLFRTACRDAGFWPSPIRLSFNVSRLQLADPMLVLRVLKVLGETGFSPTRLELEVSEDALVGEIDAAKAALAALHQAGIRIALDDFGSGNSSLYHLRECAFDRLKIDRSFIAAMRHSQGDAAFVRAILSLSHALGLPVTAEGIEDERLVATLLAEGCSDGQGSRFGAAMPADAVQKLIDRRSAERHSG
jgi:diguanylate cyclase (GGDEF)-like protein